MISVHFSMAMKVQSVSHTMADVLLCHPQHANLTLLVPSYSPSSTLVSNCRYLITRST
eukprot:COSAG02_NODE_64_length_43111_cov_35.627709_26_plen_58_part_00